MWLLLLEKVIRVVLHCCAWFCDVFVQESMTKHEKACPLKSYNLTGILGAPARFSESSLPPGPDPLGSSCQGPVLRCCHTAKPRSWDHVIGNCSSKGNPSCTTSCTIMATYSNNSQIELRSKIVMSSLVDVDLTMWHTSKWLLKAARSWLTLMFRWRT